MKSKKNLVLIGMMGSGKSTIGELLAKKLKFKFFDIDKIIEKKIKMKIVDIFEIKGEIFFRNLERKISLKILDYNNSVISLGGGAFTNDIIRKKALNKSETFWLNWNPNTLIDRVKKNKKRPIALKLNDNELNNLIKQRSNFYLEAKYKINCENLNKSEIIDKILNLYETN